MTTLKLKKAEDVAVAAEGTWDLADRLAKAIKERMAAPGALNLPPLLEARRLRYGIPNEAFEIHAVYNWVLVHQIEPKWEDGGKTFGDTSILKPETSLRRDKLESSRGVIVTAGLSALDNLKTNGMDVGHIISFVKIAPWIRPTASYNGHELNLVVLRDGDLISSEDLQGDLASGKCKVTYDLTARQHHYVDEFGVSWVPKAPFIDDSY